MTELISRDTPIYCMVAFNDEIQVQKANTTRDVWKNRFGFNKFYFYDRINRASRYKQELIDLNSNLLKTVSFKLDLPQIVESYRLMDLMVLFKKVIAQDLDNIIIIGHNSSLQHDIPATWAQNDISFLRVDENNFTSGEGGFVVSKDYAIAYVDYMLKTYFANDFTLQQFYVDCESRNRYYDRYLIVKDKCITNIEEMRAKTNEEMNIVEV